MNKLFRVFITLSALVFISLIAWSLVVLDSVERSVSASAGRGGKTAAVFHFIALLPAMERDLFYIRAYNGMKDVAAANRAVVQVFEYTPGEGVDSVNRLLRLIGDVNPDGVVLSLQRGSAHEEAVLALAEQNIPLVTLEHDLATSRRNAHVGTNAFDLGKLAARAAVGRKSDGGRLGILISMGTRDNPARDATFVQGFRQILREFPDSELALIRSSQEGQAGGEEFVREILVSHPDIDTAVFTSARDAEGAAQALIEFGRVGSLTVIAFDDTPELRKLMETGVVAATVSRNAEDAGRAAMDALLALAAGGRTNAYVDPGASILYAEDLQLGRRP